MSVPDITVMVYFAADNDLWENQVANLDALLQGYALAGSPANINFQILVDSENGDHYYLTVSGDTQVRTDLGYNPDTGSAETLAWFVDTAMAASPDSDFYSLVLWNHGGGLTGALQDFESGNIISVPGIAGAIKGKKIDVLAFDACLMAGSELVSEFDESTIRYLVASTEAVGAKGLDYTCLTAGLLAASTEYEIAQAFLETAKGSRAFPNVSITDLALAGELTGAMNRFAEVALKLDSGEFLKLLRVVNESLWHGGSTQLEPLDEDYYSTELFDYLKRVIRYFDGDSAIVAAARELLAAAGNAVSDYLGRGFFYGRGGGLSVALPVLYDRFEDFSSHYDKLGLTANDSAWYQFVRRLAGVAPEEGRGSVYRFETGLLPFELPDGGGARDLGVFTGGGLSFRCQSIFAGEELCYRFVVRDGEEPGTGGGVTVKTAAGGTEFTYVLTDLGGAVIGSGQGTGEVAIPGALLAAGDYLLRISAGSDAFFTISFAGELVGSVDRFDDSARNDTPETATGVGFGFYTGLTTSSDDPDYYRFTGEDVFRHTLLVSGADITDGSITVTAYLEDGSCFDAMWNPERNAYVADLEEVEYFRVIGGDGRVLNYDFNILIGDADIPDPDLFFAGDFSGSGRELLFAEAMKVEYGGFYSLTPDFCDFGELNVKITLLDNRNRKVASGTVKNGKISWKTTLLAAGTYSVKVEKQNRGAEGSFEFNFTGEDIFLLANEYNDDWTELKTRGAEGLGGVGNSPEAIRLTIPRTDDDDSMGLYQDWVGFGDAIDYRQLDVEYAGDYSFELHAAESIVFSLYVLQENKNGTYRLKKLRSIGANAKKDAEDEAVGFLSGVLLEKGTYYVSVKSANASKGGDAGYSVWVDLEDTRFFTAAENGDDDWRNLAERFQVLLDDSEEAVFLDEWVGFGDLVDYRKLEVAESGSYTLNLETSGKVGLSLYLERADGKLVRLKSITVAAGREGAIRDVLLNAGSTYYVMTESVGGKKGKEADYQAWSPVADRTIYASLNPAGEFREAHEFARKEVFQLTFEADGGTFAFEDFDDFKVQLYRYNGKTNGLSAVGIRKNETAGLTGSFYLRLTAKNETAGELFYSDNLFSWRESDLMAGVTEETESLLERNQGMLASCQA